MKFTDLESRLLDQIAHAEMSGSNGATPETNDEHGGTWLWVDEFSAALGVSMPVYKGALGSLVAKGALYVVDGGTADAAVGFTDEGFNTWKATQSK